jgi:transposase-like protein
VLAVRWDLRYGLWYRDVKELLAERGITVDHVTIYAGYNTSHHCSSTQPALPARPGRPAPSSAARG